MVTRVTASEPHKNWAFERFRKEGPLALLPLDSHDFAVVWTLQQDQADAVMAQSDTELLASLQSQIGYRCGRFTRIGERLTYPLALVKSSEQVTGYQRGGFIAAGLVINTQLAWQIRAASVSHDQQAGL